MNVRSLKKLYLTVYRFVGFAVLTSALSFLALYGVVMLFFLFNNNWISPSILTNTSDKMLQFASGYQTAFQNYQTLKVSEAQATRDVEYAFNNVHVLSDLSNEMEKYDNRIDILGRQKAIDLIDSYNLMNGLDSFVQATKKSLGAGLITNEEASHTLAGIQSFHNSTTDGNLALHNLKLNTHAQTVQIFQQLTLAQNDEQTKLQSLAAVRESLALATREIETLRSSAYYSAMNEGVNLAFLPYDNSSAYEGAPIYSCYLVFVACHQVGQVKYIFKDEQLIDFPLFNVRLNRTVRGVLMSVYIDDSSYMKEQVLFVGRKPLFL